MNEKGLTLIELLAVVVILAIIAAISAILIGQIIENSKKDAAISMASQMIYAAKVYEATDKRIDTNGITIQTLQDEGLIGVLIDPSSKEVIPSDSKVLAENENKKKGSSTYYIVTLKTTDCHLVEKTETDLNSLTRKELCALNEGSD